MNITTTILTVGTALRHAQQAGVTVEVLLGDAWMSGQVTAVDGEGVCMVTPDGGATVIRISSINAVRIEALAEPETPAERAPYDGFRFPKPDRGRPRPDDAAGPGTGSGRRRGDAVPGPGRQPALSPSGPRRRRPPSASAA